MNMDEHEKNVLEAIGRIDDWKGKKVEHEPAEGFTNSVWKVKVDGKAFFVKVPDKGTDTWIDRDSCHAANLAAAKAGIAPAVRYYFEDTGVEVFDWLEGYRSLISGDVYTEELFHKMADTIRTFHQQDVKLPRTQTAFEQTAKLMSQVKVLGGYMPAEYDRMEWLVNSIEDAVMTAGIDYVPCHNEHVAGNYMYNGDTGDIKLIDWEYASMNDASWDLAVHSGGQWFTESMDLELIRRYYGEYDEVNMAKLKLYQILADIKWGFWAITQAEGAPIGFDFYFWYGTKIDRLRHFWNDPRLDYWLNVVKGRSPFR